MQVDVFVFVAVVVVVTEHCDCKGSLDKPVKLTSRLEFTVRNIFLLATTVKRDFAFI